MISAIWRHRTAFPKTTTAKPTTTKQAAAAAATVPPTTDSAATSFELSASFASQSLNRLLKEHTNPHLHTLKHPHTHIYIFIYIPIDLKSYIYTHIPTLLKL